MSNHTLRRIHADNSDVVAPFLGVNRRRHGCVKLYGRISTIKILQCHEDFDMQPFFEWEFKCLPLVVKWFENASSCRVPRRFFEPNIERRKLSCIYQFVKGLPLLYVEACLKKQLEDIKAKEKQMEDEQLKIEKEELELQRAQLMLRLKKQEFGQRKQSVEDHKLSIMKKLGQKLS